MNIPEYRLINKLFEGETTVVWRAIDETDQCCVLKTLRASFPKQSSLRSIRQEFELAQQLAQPKIEPDVQLLDFKSTLALRINAQGLTLREVLNHQNKALELSFTLSLLLKMCDVLAPLHTRGLVHGSLQPNHWMWNDETMDLQLINLGRTWAPPKQVSNINIQALHYIAPEQTGRLARQDVDKRADLYALGIIAFECLTGSVPHSGENALEIIHSHIAHSTDVIVGVPSLVERIVHKLLAKACKDRYQSIEGLKADLILAQTNATAHATVTLGTRDKRTFLSLDQTFQGHPQSMGKLLKAYTNSLNSKGTLAIVEGKAGIGKTRLLHCLRETLLGDDVIVLQSRFMGLETSPYDALFRILEQFAHHVLMRDAETIEFWKQRLLGGAQGQGAMLTMKVPEFKLILGEQPRLDVIETAHAQRAIHTAMANIVSAMVTTEHPFVICLDDAHKADPPSLDLLIHLLNTLTDRPLLIVATVDPTTTEYIENEPYIRARLDNVDVITIKMKPPGQKKLSSWLARTLQRSVQDIQPLAKIAQRDTDGYPRQLSTWLQKQHTKKLIYFDQTALQWKWLIEAMEHDSIDDEHILERLKKLGPIVQKTIGLAACFPEKINTDIIQEILSLNILELHASLAVAQEMGIMVRQAVSASMDTEWAFVHKSQQQQILDNLSPHQLTSYHSSLGQAFRKMIPHSDFIYAAVYHLNRATALLSSTEKADLLALNIEAGEQTWLATGFNQAIEHFEQAYPLLTPITWKTHPELGLAFLDTAIRAALAAQNYERAQYWVQEYADNANNEESTTKAILLQIKIHVGLMQVDEAILVTRNALASLGITFPANPSSLHVLTECVKLQTRLFTTTEEDMLNAPPMTDTGARHAMAIMYTLMTTLYVVQQQITQLFLLKMVALSKQFGVAPETPFAYAGFGIILASNLNQIDRGYQYGQIALTLAQKHSSGSIKAFTHLAVYNYIAPYKEPASQQVEPLFEAYRLARAAGDHECASACLLDRLKHAWSAGLSVDKLRDSLEQMNLYADQIHVDHIQVLYKPWLWLFDTFQLEDVPPIDDGSTLPIQLRVHYTRNRILTQLIHATYFHDLDTVGALIAEASDLDLQIVSIMEQSTKHLMYGLYHAQMARQQSGIERQTTLAKLFIHLGRLKHWSIYAPHNHKHRLILLEAEYAALMDRPRKAARNFDESTRLAIDNGFFAEAGLCSERTCLFFQNRAQFTTATRYLEYASELYQHAGLITKSANLRDKFAPLFDAMALEGNHAAPYQAMDMHSLLKAAQLLSSEVVLERLIDKLLQITLENSGAQRGVVLLKNENNILYVEQELHLDENAATIETATTLEEATHTLATHVINFAARTKQTVAIDDANQNMQFFSDPYISFNTIHSVMCLPIVRQQKLLALIYLENNLAPGIFTHAKRELLELLSTQIAIALENATLYATLEQKVLARTTELEGALKRLEYAANTDYLTGIYNRMKFTQIATQTFRRPGPHSVILIDLDRFKLVNDKHGHLVGDSVLKHLTNHLSEHLREDDTLARWGGEEFVILLPDTTKQEGFMIAQRLLDMLRQTPHKAAGTITFSAGVSQYIREDSIDTLLNRADQALYSAKDLGRNRVVCTDNHQI